MLKSGNLLQHKMDIIKSYFLFDYLFIYLKNCHAKQKSFILINNKNSSLYRKYCQKKEKEINNRNDKSSSQYSVLSYKRFLLTY